MYPSSDKTIATTTAAIRARSLQEEVAESNWTLEKNFMGLLRDDPVAQHLINTKPEKLHAHKSNTHHHLK